MQMSGGLLQLCFHDILSSARSSRADVDVDVIGHMI